MEDIVIVGAARTAIGKFGGTLAKVPAAELGAHGHPRAARRKPASSPTRSPKSSWARC